MYVALLVYGLELFLRRAIHGPVYTSSKKKNIITKDNGSPWESILVYNGFSMLLYRGF